jgi:hypothetical protein
MVKVCHWRAALSKLTDNLPSGKSCVDLADQNGLTARPGQSLSTSSEAIGNRSLLVFGGAGGGFELPPTLPAKSSARRVTAVARAREAMPQNAPISTAVVPVFSKAVENSPDVNSNDASPKNQAYNHRQYNGKDDSSRWTKKIIIHLCEIREL